MPFDKSQRTTRRRSSAGPVPPRRPAANGPDRGYLNRQGPRPTFLALKDHGKVYVADLPYLSDGQLTQISKEASEVLASLERRIAELESTQFTGQTERDTLIKACTKRDVTNRFLRAIVDEQEHRRNNPAVRNAANESLPRTFLEIARHRLPGTTFDSLLQEALAACEQQASEPEPAAGPAKVITLQTAAASLPVVVSPDPEPSEAGSA